jgi:two-component system chemotaxis response regulator CheY
MARVLAVDDSPSIRQIVSFTLRGAGHDVIEAVDGQDALEKSEGQTFDVVLTDQNMPRCDGLTLVRTLRQRDDFGSTPILMLTTESSSEMKDAGRQAGATGWLVKPFDPVKLLELIEYVTQPR